MLQTPLPLELSPQQQASLQREYRGCLSFTVLPQHVATEAAVTAVLHNLLMLYSYLDMQVCSLKVCP